MPGSHIKQFDGSNAKARDIEDALGKLVQGKGDAGNTLVVYIAGHGYYGNCIDNKGVPSRPHCDRNGQEPYLFSLSILQVMRRAPLAYQCARSAN